MIPGLRGNYSVPTCSRVNTESHDIHLVGFGVYGLGSRV